MGQIEHEAQIALRMTTDIVLRAKESLERVPEMLVRTNAAVHQSRKILRSTAPTPPRKRGARRK